MAYVSLYRKYRSQTFEDVMGQEHVTKTLQNSIKLNKVAHAYLFCGTRGTGKTTTARLLAKSLNCEKGPSPIPCNECPACVSITSGSAMDIIEMDAASHRGIGDVKDINENVKFPPMELRYKVFIIDEAHQLSNDAKDAFLKTLEEPPAHAVFILATTEPQSIPVTIRSRCQQFEFRRGSLRDIRNRIKHVVEKEGVNVDETALDLMAMNADGSWRDALSLLEQVLAYTDGDVTSDDVNAVLGTVNQDFLFKLADTLAGGDQVGAFTAAQEIAESGRDIQQLLKSLSQHFRNLLFASVSNDLTCVTANEDDALRFKDQAQKLNRMAILRVVEQITEAEREIRFSDQHRLILELTLLKIIETLNPSKREQYVPAAEPESAQPASTPRQAEKPKAETKPETPPQASETTIPKMEEVELQQNLPEFDKIKAKWSQVLQRLRVVSVSAHALVSQAEPSEIRNGSLVLQFQGKGQKDLFQNETTRGKGLTKRQALMDAIKQVFGVADVGIICEVKAAEKALVPPVEENENLPNPFEDNSPGDQETLKDVLDIFPDASIVDEN